MKQVARLALDKQSRYGFLDAIRGVAACAVMLQHSLYQSGLLGDWPSKKLTGFIPTWLELGETGVVAFFLVSGFVIPFSLERTANFRLFWIHRAFRIYPLYLCVLAASLILQGTGSFPTIRSLVANLVAHLAFIQEYVDQKNFVGGSWTLSLELVWYLLISAVFTLSLRRSAYYLVGLAGAVSVGGWAICASGHHVPMGRISMLLCCIVGFFCYRLDRLEIERRNFFSACSTLGSLIVLNLIVGDAIFPSRHPSSTVQMALPSWALAAVVFFLPFITRSSDFWRRGILAFLGRISYSVYLLHPLTLLLLGLLSVRGYPLVLCAFMFTIPVSTVTYRYIEAPAIRFGHRLVTRRSGASIKAASPAIR